MKVKLVSHSTPAPEFRAEGLETIQDLIAFCAKVSNPNNQINNETAEKLIAYLVKHSHWSPLEMVSVCLEITTTRDIARQIIRHRSFSYQEFSQRYSNIDEIESPFVLREARLQDAKNRQNSIETDDPQLQEDWNKAQQEVIDVAKRAYDWAIKNKIAKEQARCVLPEGNTVSRMYMSGSIRSWIHYLDLRRGNGTQKEHQDIALECAKIISTIFPLVK